MILINDHALLNKVNVVNKIVPKHTTHEEKSLRLMNLRSVPFKKARNYRDPFCIHIFLGDPGADSGGEGKSKQAGKYGTKEK